MCYSAGMDDNQKVSVGQSIVGVCSLLLLGACFFVALKGCQEDAVPVSYEFAAGDEVVVETGLESGTVAFIGLADLKKWEQYAEAGDVEAKMRIESVCKSLGGGCRLHDGVRGVVVRVEGENALVQVAGRRWWVQDYALKRAY